MKEIKTEKPEWNMNLSKWRIANKYTSQDWNDYAEARTDQMYVFAVCTAIIFFALGILVGIRGV